MNEVDQAIQRCEARGVGVVAVRNSGHYGAAGAYAAMAAERGLIGLATTSTPTPAVVPTFGRRPMLGTNPVAVAAPAARNRSFLLDMATSTVSLGKLAERWQGGKRIPRSWALDDRGRLWVVEAHTYPVRAPEGEGSDRILIFEDTNGDGRCDTRVGIFDPRLQGYFWDFDNHGLRLVQLRFYPIPD